jgi:phosphoethanolamine N-methyltransferase
VLKPGGWFVASDWLAGYDSKPPPEMQAYLVAEGFGLGLTSEDTYTAAMKQAGFIDIEIVYRND